MTITSRPTVEYFAVTDRHALGGPIYLLLTDADIEFDKIAYTQEQWAETEKARHVAEYSSHRPTLPALILDGQQYRHHLPILRLLARRLNRYLPRTEEEIYAVDSLVDLLTDYHFYWAMATFGNAEELKDKFTVEQPKMLAEINRYLTRFDSGPYDLGAELSYASFILYTYVSDSKADTTAYPRLQQFMDAMTARVNAKSKSA